MFSVGNCLAAGLYLNLVLMVCVLWVESAGGFGVYEFELLWFRCWFRFTSVFVGGRALQLVVDFGVVSVFCFAYYLIGVVWLFVGLRF